MLRDRHIVIFDSPKQWHKWLVYFYLSMGKKVYIIEPFHAYHHKKGRIKFFPEHLPQYIYELIQKKKIEFLHVKDLGARDVYPLAAERAVELVECVYPHYKSRYTSVINFVVRTLKSSVAESAFKKELCDKLAEFLSMNITIQRMSEHFGGTKITLYPDTNLPSYFLSKLLLQESQQDFFEHVNVCFPFLLQILDVFDNFKQNILIMLKLFGQMAASIFLSRNQTPSAVDKRNFTYAVAVVGERQLRDDKRGPDFIVDHCKIQPSEVVYIPIVDLSQDKVKLLKKLPGEFYLLSKLRRYFSHPLQWTKLFLLGLWQAYFRSGGEFKTASSLLMNYFRWSKVLDEIAFRHFISNSDFSISHIGRNIALHQAGIQTWYFTDSMNSGRNYGDNMLGRHPFWTYLGYDHLVTWNETLAEYYAAHPGSFRSTHVVGAIWGDHIQGKKEPHKTQSSYVVACFDSTYSCNGPTCYQEGIEYAKHILRLTDEHSDLQVVFKEKKSRSIHHVLDPVHGHKLLELYQEMSAHPRITICSYEVDASELISTADMVISFPFTSTTFEAISANKRAIWHDALGYYKNSLYGKQADVVTSGYEELSTAVTKLKTQPFELYQNPFSKNSPLMDPYRDGNAIARFRDRLVAS